MIPKFPQFKLLEFSDKEDIEQITAQYEPYSDFNFESLWSWDVSNKFKISDLNGNLVMILTDHFTDERFYTFLGNNMVNRTLKALFAFPISDSGPIPQLRLVPEVSMTNIDLSRFLIEIDLNNCDYVYDVMELSTYPGGKFSKKRGMASSFSRNYSKSKVVVLDYLDNEVKNQIEELNQAWIKNKSKSDNGFDLEKESKAIARFMEYDYPNTLCTGIYIDNKLSGYQMFSILTHHQSICHFAKANRGHYGLYEYLMKGSAEILLNKGILYLNYEEDLGLPGLRYSKNSFKPSSFLRKYTIKEI